MKFLSLFSGIGGFDLALTRAGAVCDSVCEIDKACQSVLTRHFPDAKLYDDVRKVGIATHERKSVDLICGGFPCQDLSVAGKRAGLAGERSGLWFEFARVIDELEPQWVVIENVPGLLSSNKGRDFAVIVHWLVERGYGVAWRILDAQYFGLAQRRRRVFIVASLGDGRAAQVLFEREGVPGDSAPSREAGAKTAATISASPPGRRNGGSDPAEGHFVCYALSASKTATGRLDPNGQDFVVGAFNGYTGGPDDNDAQANHIVAFDLAQITSNVNRTRVSPELPASTLNQAGQMHVAYNIQHNDGGDHKRKDRPNGGMYVNETDTALTVGTTDLTAIAWHENKQGELSQGNTAKALRSGASHSYQGVGVRRLTPTECERLQGFPDGWTSGQSDSTRYRQLGNAVAVPVVEWLARRIVESNGAQDEGQNS